MYLTQDERAELDALMYEAGYDEGKPRPSHEIGARVVAMLRETSDQTRREWAGMLLDDLLEDGALKRWKKWNSAREVVTVAGQSYVTTKAAAMSVRKSDEDGRTYYQATFWDDMTREELEQVIARAAKQIESESRTVALAKRLVALMNRVPEAQTVAQAADALGLTTERYLAVVEAA